jgi:RNA:NAD 2'-phosphotransferase (TPT1/KptA family)
MRKLHGFIDIRRAQIKATERFWVRCSAMKYTARTVITLRTDPTILLANSDVENKPINGARINAGTSATVTVKFDIVVGNIAGAVPGENK